MSYTQETIHEIVEAQRAYFRSGETLDTAWRTAQLKKFRQAVLDREDLLCDALHEDLGRSRTEAFLCDIGPVIAETNEIIRGLKKWARPERHFSGLGRGRKGISAGSCASRARRPRCTSCPTAYR